MMIDGFLDELREKLNEQLPDGGHVAIEAACSPFLSIFVKFDSSSYRVDEVVEVCDWIIPWFVRTRGHELLDCAS